MTSLSQRWKVKQTQRKDKQLISFRSRRKLIHHTYINIRERKETFNKYSRNLNISQITSCVCHVKKIF